MASFVDLSDASGSGFSKNFELALEGLYAITVSENLTIKPDLQYILNPDGDKTSNDALVETLRTELTF